MYHKPAGKSGRFRTFSSRILPDRTDGNLWTMHKQSDIINAYLSGAQTAGREEEGRRGSPCGFLFKRRTKTGRTQAMISLSVSAHNTIAPPNRVLCQRFPAAHLRNAVAFLHNAIIPRAPQPGFMPAFSGGAMEKCCCISPQRHHTLRPPNRVLSQRFPAAQWRNAVAFFHNVIIL